MELVVVGGNEDTVDDLLAGVVEELGDLVLIDVDVNEEVLKVAVPEQ